MVRHRLHFMPALGRFNEGTAWVRQLNEAARAAGCAEGRLWALSFGQVNECVLESDYPSLAEFAADQARFQSDPGCMKAFRAGTGIGEPSFHPWDELLEEAPTLA